MAVSPQQFLTQELGRAVDYFKPQYQELSQAQNKAYGMLPEVMQEFQKQQASGQFQNPGVVGTQFTGPSPLESLGVGLGRIGEQFGIADTIGRGVDFQRGRLETIIGDLLGQYNQEQALRASRAGGGFGGFGSFGGTTKEGFKPTPRQESNYLVGKAVGNIGANAVAMARDRAAKENTLLGQVQRGLGSLVQIASSLSPNMTAKQKEIFAFASPRIARGDNLLDIVRAVQSRYGGDANSISQFLQQVLGRARSAGSILGSLIRR